MVCGYESTLSMINPCTEKSREKGRGGQRERESVCVSGCVGGSLFNLAAASPQGCKSYVTQSCCIQQN